MQTVRLVGLILYLLICSTSIAAEPVHATEASLLHRRIDLHGVRVLDGSKIRWNPLTLEGSRLYLIHLWAVECKPCVAEMPLLKNIALGWKNDSNVNVLFISETLDEKQLREFWFQTAKDRVPDVPLMQSVDDRVREVLGTGKQPITLLVDRDLVVRQAFVGSLAERTGELAESMSRLHRVLRSQR